MSRSGEPRLNAERRAGGWRPLRTAERAAEALAVGALWGIVGLLFCQAAFRYLLGVGLAWPDELARFLQIVVVFVTLGAVTRTAGHVRVDFVARRLRRPAIDRLLLLVEVAAAAGLAAGATVIVWRLGAFRTPALAMPLALFFLPTAVGFAMMTFERARQWRAPR